MIYVLIIGVIANLFNCCLAIRARNTNAIYGWGVATLFSIGALFQKILMNS
jgi:hypothetical protein